MVMRVVTWVRRLLNDKNQVFAQPFAVTGDCTTCGDANNDQLIAATDALGVLQAAVGLNIVELICACTGCLPATTTASTRPTERSTARRDFASRLCCRDGHVAGLRPGVL
jgi:hypothetical protein